MNTHARNPRFKMTMISIHLQGRHITIFAYVPVGYKGKIALDEKTWEKVREAFGVPHGMCVGVGV
jgi:hypothetical protein